MVVAALEALVGDEPAGEAVVAALATIPAGELEAALRWLAREHGMAALPILRRCLASRPEHAIAAAQALGTLAVPEAVDALEHAGAGAAPKAIRTATRRALYRLRQVGVERRAPAPPPTPAPGVTPAEAWVSAVDGTGSRGLWLTFAGPHGERTLLQAILSEDAGLVDFSAGPLAKKRVEERLRALRNASPLPWVAAPASWAWASLVEAATRTRAAGRPVPLELARWIERIGTPAAEPAPIHPLRPASTHDLARLERSAELLALPELTGWFLGPERVASEAVEWLQAQESRLVVSDQIKVERLAALIDRVIETQFDAAARQRWQARLEEQAYVLLGLGREEHARTALAVAHALGDPAHSLRRVPFLRALAERSLEVAGEVATGRLSAEAASRAPRVAAAPAPGA
jgi:hypothetical protein